MDGSWGEVDEEFYIDASVEATGAYVVRIAPVSGGVQWDNGCEVGLEVCEDEL
jgi:hypothetical protein